MKIAARVTRVLAVSVVAGALAAGCATNKDVDRKIGLLNGRVKTEDLPDSDAESVTRRHREKEDDDGQLP